MCVAKKHPTTAAPKAMRCYVPAAARRAGDRHTHTHAEADTHTTHAEADTHTQTAP